MLGWLLLGALLAAAVITISVTYLNRDIAKRKLEDHDICKAVVKDIIYSGSVAHVKMDALMTDGEEVEVDIEAEDYNSSQIYKGTVIYT